MKIFCLAGEPSGDLLGADLINAIRNENASLDCYGAGGHHMAAAGQKQCLNLANHAVIGLWDVLAQYPKFHKFFNFLIEECVRTEPDAIIAIDNPGFNLRFISRIRELMPKVKVYYYVSPQVWAWKPGRAKILKKYVDLLICIFPFEPDWFREHCPGLHAVWVGHPILDRLFLPESNTLRDDKITIALMPGSRTREVSKHLPLLLETAMLMSTVQGNFAFRCLAPTPAIARLEQSIIDERVGLALDIQVLSGYAATHLSRSHLALVASGTATLECALACTPMIVFYHVNWLTYWAGRFLIKLPYLSIVNLLLNKSAVPELIQTQATPHRMARTALEILSSDQTRKQQQEDMKRVVEILGEPGASRYAAKLILANMEKL